MLGYDPGLDWSPREVGQERKAELGGAGVRSILRHPEKTVVVHKGGHQESGSLPAICQSSPFSTSPQPGPGDELADSMGRLWLSRSMSGLPGRHLVYQLCAPGRVTQVPFYEWERLGGICHRAICSE